jgi:heptosyltransferase-3
MGGLREEIAAALARKERLLLTVVRAGGLGDTLLVMPALQFLLREYPATEITLVGSAWAERLLPIMARPPGLLRFDSPHLTPVFRPSCPEDPSGAFATADVVIAYVSRPADDFTANLHALCPGPVVVWPVQPPGEEHAAVHFARAVADPPPALSELRPADLHVGRRLRTWARDWLASHLPDASAPLAVHPGSGGAAKCWPVERFACLIRHFDRPVIVFEGPSDADACDRLGSLLEGGPPVAPASSLSVPQVAALLLTCGLYVGNDSGLTHLAAALGVSVVAVFGPTDPLMWGPVGAAVRCVGGTGSGDPWPAVDRVIAACAGLAP